MVTENQAFPVVETIQKQQNGRIFADRPRSPLDRASLAGGFAKVSTSFGLIHMAERETAPGGEELGTYSVILKVYLLGVSVSKPENARLAAGYGAVSGRRMPIWISRRVVWYTFRSMVRAYPEQKKRSPPGERALFRARTKDHAGRSIYGTARKAKGPAIQPAAFAAVRRRMNREADRWM